MNSVPKKAIALFSGGADSLLAMHLVLRQGVEVTALNFNNCNFNTRNDRYLEKLERRCSEIGLDLRNEFLGEEYLRMLAGPKFGYGRAFNPCIDCHIMMLRRSRVMMMETGAGFVVTGEVVGQRPKSQHMQALRLIEAESGLRGRLLRPLSARLLPPTIPELARIVDRLKLGAVSGRGRKAQAILARELGVPDLPGSGGGCLLTERRFSEKVRDLFTHAEGGIPSVADAQLLKHGRHFRLFPNLKVIIGKNHQENLILASLAGPGDLLFSPTGGIKGPTAMARGGASAEVLPLIASLLLRYCDVGAGDEAVVAVREATGDYIGTASARPMPGDKVKLYRI
jgi:tRNA-specific 2-thiouridylase